jgi:hypothetical protein
MEEYAKVKDVYHSPIHNSKHDEKSPIKIDNKNVRRAL